LPGGVELQRAPISGTRCQHVDQRRLHLIVTIICLVFPFHARSALVAVIVLPLAVLLSFIAIRYLGLSSNIMSLGGIAIAIPALSLSGSAYRSRSTNAPA
jgi:Cu(I)/Ag(I) efflux system membrane protein CusA/SilA